MSGDLDWDFLGELREIMEDEFDLLLATYLDESAKQFHAVCRAADDGTMDELRRSAHCLKGSCANIGAGKLTDLCFTLEQTAKNGEVGEGEVEALIASIGQELEAVSTAVSDLRNA